MKLTTQSIAIKKIKAIVIQTGNDNNVQLAATIKAIVTQTGNDNNVQLAATLNAAMVECGFIMSRSLFEYVKTLSADAIESLYSEVIPALEQMIGKDVPYTPMYPNFPSQVMEASDVELYVNAIAHYWTDGTWLPEFEKVQRSQFSEDVKLRELTLASQFQFEEVFTRLLSSNESINDQDRNIIEWFMDNPDVELRFPETIPYKENVCVVAGMFLKQDREVTKLITTTTDVLRVLTYLSDGDVSLATNTKFKSISRKTRRHLIQALELVAKEEDFERHRNKWIKAFHCLHVGDYSEALYSQAKVLRENQKIATFNSKVERALEANDHATALKLLKTRPTELSRRLDNLLVKFDKKAQRAQTINAFVSKVDDIPTRALLQLKGHMSRRGFDLNRRIVFPKANVQKAQVVTTPIPALETNDLLDISSAINTSLSARFSKMDELGKVYVDPNLIDCPVPSQMRSASEGLFQVARGTHIPFGDKEALRMFIYWKGRDIDLSCTLHDENFKQVGQTSYTRVKNEKFESCHSGDITNAPNGASEFIDIQIDKAFANGARYAAMQVYVYSGPTFSEHEICYAGWMTRNKVQSGEVYEPKSVQQKIDVRSATRKIVPVVFDLKKRTAIWVDVNPGGFKTGYGYANNVENNTPKVEELVQSIMTMDHKTSLYELFTLHGEARGTLVDTPEEADTVFGFEDGVTPFDIDVINSEFIAD